MTACSYERVRRTARFVAGALFLSLCPAASMAGQDLQTSRRPGEDLANNAGGDASTTLEAWRIIHTKGADGVSETTAILRVAEVLRSDPRLAGLMLRCSKQGVEPVIVVVEPFSPQARPKITLRADDQEFYFEGKPLPTGEGLRVPANGLDLVQGPWKDARELMISISDGGAEIGGVVELSGLPDAIRSLDGCAGK